MADGCQFARYDASGNEVYRCGNPVHELRLIPGQTQLTWRVCPEHLYWAPDMQWWRG
jgi:hypothetical protein